MCPECAADFVAPCQGWCADNTEELTAKCGYKGCYGCSECAGIPDGWVGQEVVTDAPVTDAPVVVTDPPATEPPVTEAPATDPPVTNPPDTKTITVTGGSFSYTLSRLLLSFCWAEGPTSVEMLWASAALV